MDFEVEALIECVKVRPALWDHKNDNYYNRRCIEKLWLAISQEMKVPAMLLKKKWKYLRDQFRLECKKIPTEKYDDSLLTPLDYDNYSTWTYFKRLFFLKSQIKNPKIKLSLMNDENEEQEDESKSADNMTVEQNDFGKMFVLENIASIPHDDYTDQIIQVQNEPLPKVRVENLKMNDDDDDERLKRLEKKLEFAIVQQSKRRNFDDEMEEDKAFFASILPHVRKLPPAEKMLCRIDIQNIVYRHVYKTDLV